MIPANETTALDYLDDRAIRFEHLANEDRRADPGGQDDREQAPLKALLSSIRCPEYWSARDQLQCGYVFETLKSVLRDDLKRAPQGCKLLTPSLAEAPYPGGRGVLSGPGWDCGLEAL